MEIQEVVYTNAANQATLALITDVGAEFEAPVVELFTNNVTPGPGMVIGDFTLADNTVFPGYAASSAVTWSADAYSFDGKNILIGSQKTFIASSDPPAPISVYGFILRKAAAGALVQAVLFPEPILIEEAGDYVTANPFLTAGPQEITVVI